MPPKKQPTASVCASCHKPFSTTDSPVSYRSKPYHPACLEAMKAAARAKDAKKSAQLNDPALKELRGYLLQLFELQSLTPLLEKQIKDMHSNESPISYEEMLLALRYFYDLQGNKVSTEYVPSIGIVPYVVDEAREFKEIVAKAEEANREFVPENKTVVVQVRPSGWSDLGYRMEDL